MSRASGAITAASAGVNGRDLYGSLSPCIEPRCDRVGDGGVSLLGFREPQPTKFFIAAATLAVRLKPEKYPSGFEAVEAVGLGGVIGL